MSDNFNKYFEEVPEYIKNRDTILANVRNDTNMINLNASLLMFFNGINKLVDENIRLQSEVKALKKAKIIKLSPKV